MTNVLVLQTGFISLEMQICSNIKRTAATSSSSFSKAYFCPVMLKSYQSKSDVTRAYIQMHLSIILWGATAVLGKGIQLTEGPLVWYRLIITSATLFLFIMATRKSFRVEWTDFLRLTGIGAILTVHWLFFYGAIKYSNVSITLSLFSSTTLFTALIEPLITKKKFNKIELVYSLIAMWGICIVFYTDSNSYSVGIILALLAAFVGAFFNILNKKMVHKMDSEKVTFYELFSGLIVMTALLPLYIQVFHPAKLVPDNLDWVLLFILSVLCTNIPLILSMNALRHLSAFTLNLSINLEPIYGIILAFFIFHENRHLNAGFFVGTALIMLSVLLHGYFTSRETPAETVDIRD
jgi:drug/metabolite transporter (DMT)-like permease